MKLKISYFYVVHDTHTVMANDMPKRVLGFTFKPCDGFDILTESARQQRIFFLLYKLNVLQGPSFRNGVIRYADNIDWLDNSCLCIILTGFLFCQRKTPGDLRGF